MQVKYNVTGARRKELVKVIADTTGAKAEYKFMPTCNYEIDYFTVTKDGTLLSMTAPTARRSSRCLKPSPPQVLNVSRRTARRNRRGRGSIRRKDNAPQGESRGAYGGDSARQGGRSRQPYRAAGCQGRPHQESPRRGATSASRSKRIRVHSLGSTEIDAGFRKGIHELHLRTLRDGKGSQARDRHGKGSRQREVRIPLLSPAAGLHWRRIQGGQENPAEEPHRLLGFQERRC
jgi:hypothetical protein